MQFKDYNNNEELKANGVVKFLERRDDKNYYKKVINKTKGKLDLLFYTGKRFSEDFCQEFDGDDEILKALNRGGVIRILLIDKSILPSDEYANFDIADNNFKRLQDTFKEQFQVKYYNHIQTHNIFSNESMSIIGPYFHNKKSKCSNSIHFLKSSPYVKDFEQFFESEWDLGA